MQEQDAHNSKPKNGAQQTDRSDQRRPDQRASEQRRRSSSRRRPRSDQRQAEQQTPNQRQGESPRPGGSRSPEQQSGQQRGSSSRRRRSSRGRRPSQQNTYNRPPRSDLVSVKDDEISVDRIMRRLSQRASELDREMHGPPTKGIIDTTNRSGEQITEASEALAAKFVREAVANDDVLRAMSGADWNLTQEYKITSHRASLVAGPLRMMKRMMRRLVRLYTDFLVTRQNRINTYLVRLCSQLVREHVRVQLQTDRVMQRLKSALEESERKLSSSVSAINARFDNNEARLDLFRSELEVRAEVMREEHHTTDLLAGADDNLDDGDHSIDLEAEPVAEDKAAAASSLDVEVAPEAEGRADYRPSSQGLNTQTFDGASDVESILETESHLAEERVSGESEEHGSNKRPAEDDLER